MGTIEQKSRYFDNEMDAKNYYNLVANHWYWKDSNNVIYPPKKEACQIVETGENVWRWIVWTIQTRQEP